MFFAKYRLIISRIAGIILALFMLFSQPVLQYGSFYNPMLILGLFLVLVCILGRTFASIFMSDKRGRSVVSEGIYSISRNPLYFFSFLGIIGIGLIYSSLLVLVLLIVFFSFYYYQVISYEEKFLSKKFGKEYTDYLNSGTPRFFPKLKLWKSEEYIEVNYKVVLKTMIDASLFFFAAIVILALLWLQNGNIIPTFLYIL
ncbi:MAG: isoprenylcysteine carboxylmethyltransferase family protein [Alphaproteobacteria bacterium]|jgi:protein-S-isoprenylcysteine O-methyltransferase Ste14|nr:isoprenylcysteine carboxylmethyltransferase family protein [Alphaproteobacteria bacterium]